MADLLKISIITVVRNGEKYLEDTISSVLGQTYSNIEYIVIDGNSTDGTLDVIRKYDKRITKWISEPDQGIYDAMNKGVTLSTGDWVLFINADDFLATPNAIEKCIAPLSGTESLVAYGNVAFVYSSDMEVLHGKEWENIRYEFRNIGMRLPHQATFHSKKLFANGLFDITFKITGDYNLLLGYLKDHDPLFIPVTVAKMRSGGVSDTISKVKLLKEIRRAHLNNHIYKNVPSINWIKYAAKLVLVDFVIRRIGIKGKDRLKGLFQ